jgi:hypothetical protein
MRITLQSSCRNHAAGMKARLADLNLTVLPGSQAEFGRFIAEDTEKWRQVVKFAGLKAE